MGFGHTYCLDGLNTHYSVQATSLKTTLIVGTVGRTYIPRTGGGMRNRFSLRVKQQSHSLDNL